MNQVVKAIEQGRCALAVSGSLLRDPEVMLALTNRAALSPMALAGPAVSPVVPVSEQGVARALGNNGVLVLVEPETADVQGLLDLGKLLERAPKKPKVIVVARNFNPFAFGTALRGLQIDHEKGRGKAFIQSLPEPPAAEELPDTPALAKPKKAASEIPAPRFHFTGRDEELAALGELLGEGGPIVVSGPRGVGRSWLVEHTIAASELKRLPDLSLGWGTGADTLATRIAEIARQGGSDALVELLKGDHTPSDVARVAVEALSAAEGTAGQVMVVRELQFAMGRELDFFRKSRLEMLLEALLTHTYPLRLIFLSNRQPTFHKEGQGASLRRFPVGGIKGRFLHEIFDAYKASDVPRDRFGAIHDRIFGNPLAARVFAIDVRDRPDGDKLPDDPKYLKLESADDLEPVKKRIGRKLEKVSAEERQALSIVAHVTVPVDGNFLADMGISRKTRLQLLAAGLLDMIGTETDRRYQVHRLVRSQLQYREISDFDTFAKIAEWFSAAAGRATDPIDRMALEQEANRCAVASRNLRLRIPVPYPDQDQWLESITGMMRARNGRIDLAEQRLREAVKRDPSNADAWILEVERLGRTQAKGEQVQATFDECAEKAAVPELFHQFVGYWLGRRNRKKAITVLEKGVELLPEEPRLRTRLAALLVRQGRRPEGIEHLEKAMELAPMLPDAYGLLGQARREEGDIAKAEELLREAVRLAPGDPVQTARLADLQLAVARVDDARRKALHDEVREMLDEVIKGDRDRKAPDAYLLLAVLVREEAGDLDRAAWLLKRARKQSERQTERTTHIAIEQALVDNAQQRVEQAEASLRQICQSDPTNHRAFAALGHVLEAQELFMPAYAEYQRAKERTPPSSLDAQAYDLHLKRVQAILEAQAAGLFQSTQPAAEPEADGAPTGHQRVIRRRKEGDAVAEGDEASAAPADELGSAEGLAADTDADATPAPEGSDEAPAQAAPESVTEEGAPADEDAEMSPPDEDATAPASDPTPSS